jgi:hypothetical protein
MALESVMRYLITMKVNGKVIQKVCSNPITYISGYLQCLLDHNDEVILDDVAIKPLKN